ncbi:MAG: hypothetical protein R3B99_27210 [Polyangiales bacterium]
MKWFGLLCVGLVACAPTRTEIVLEIGSPLRAPDEIDTLVISPFDDPSERRVLPLDARTLPATVVLLPEGDDLGPHRVIVEATASGRRVVGTELEVRFERGRSIVLPVSLESSCTDVRCGVNETCRRGECSGGAGVERDAGVSLPEDASPGSDGGSRDAGAAEDAGGERDAGSDAGAPEVDAGTDAGDMCACRGSRCECLAGCDCTAECTGRCESICRDPGTRCMTTIADPNGATVDCRDEASCDVYAENGESLSVDCRGSRCDVTCTDVARCEVTCTQGARCRCRGEGCSLEGCPPGRLTRCADGWACGQAC